MTTTKKKAARKRAHKKAAASRKRNRKARDKAVQREIRKGFTKPRVLPGEERTRVTQMKFTEAEYAWLAKQAGGHRSTSHYILELILAKIPAKHRRSS